jgi:SNF2 family DNA or RNA helicase
VRPRSDLRPAQVRSAEEIKTALGLQLVAPMGGGKTVATLTALVDLLAARTIRTAIIVAPVRVALTVWPNEIHKWEHTKDLDLVVLSGTPERRTRLLKEPHRVYVCSTDSLVWLIDALRKFPKGDARWDMLVIDELSRFKSPRGERAKKLNRFADRFGARVGLTGTPRPNGWMDQYMPLQLVSAGEAWDTSGFDDWRRKHFMQRDFRGFSWEVHQHALPYIQRVIDDWTLTIPPEESTDVPFNSGPEFDVVVPLTPAQKADLASLEKELLVEIGAEGVEVLDDSEEVVAALSQATASGKMAQVLQGFLYRDGATVQTYGKGKLDALNDLLAGMDGENCIIVYEYRHDLALLKKHLPTARWVDRDQSEDEFVELIAACKRGEVQYLLAHPANLGHGIDGLQDGFARMIWWNMSWSSEQYEQMVRRIARPGQTRPVYVHHILSDHWLEQKRLARVQGKIAEQNDFIRSLKRL